MDATSGRLTRIAASAASASMQHMRVADFFHHPELAVAVTFETAQPPFPPHRHEFAELVIVAGGAVFLAVGTAIGAFDLREVAGMLRRRRPASQKTV